jgi:pyruvate dehydrogenase E1 component beta subunit
MVVVDEAWPYASVASEIAYRVQRHAFDYLDAPVVRVNSADTSLGYAPTLVEEYLPNPTKVIKAVKEVMYINA